MIAIINYGAGNLESVKRAFKKIGVDTTITDKKEDILKAEKIILPGVGSFNFIMKNLRDNKLEEPIKGAIKKGTPYLGICLGIQILFEKSEESPGIKGLSIFEGEVKRFATGKIPQIGWNEIIPKNELFKKDFFYFVNSYFVVPKDKRIIGGETIYYKKFTSAIKYKNITAVQFHPEKSGKAGLEFLKRWVEC